MTPNARVPRPGANRRPEETPEARRLVLSGFVLDLAAGELLTADHQLAGLRKQALDVLLLLGARAGQVVSKDELMRAVWPDVVVGESSLAKAVSDIRQVLRDHDHRLLRNVARRGYMLAADPRPRESAAQSPLSESVPSVSLVVLPLRAERGTVAEQIADAITADLTNGMDRMSGSCVIGHETATSMYRGKDIDPRIAARELGVRYVVAGSLRRLDERLRLGLAMVDGESGLQLWSDQLDVNATEIESSVDDIVGQLTRSVFVQLFHAVGDRAARLTPELVTADDLAMRGWSVYFRVLSGGNFREALRLFEEALAKDPNSVRALAGVSTASSFGVMLEYLADRAAALRRAEKTNGRLEQLGADDWFALTARVVLANARHDWERMLQVANLMVTRFPRDPTSHQQRSVALMRLGDFEESLAAAQRAVRFSPRDSRFGLLHLCVATNQFILERYAEAAYNAGRMQAASPNIPMATPLLAASLVRSGRRAEGESLLREHLSGTPDFNAARVAALLPGSHPRFAEGRERLIASLREIGLP